MRAQTFFITALLVTIIIIGAKGQSGPFLSRNHEDLGAEFVSARDSVLNTDPSDFHERMGLLSDFLGRKRIDFDAVYIICGNGIKAGNFMDEGGYFDVGGESCYISPSSEREISGSVCEISWEGNSLGALGGEYCVFMNISRSKSFVSDTFCGKVL